MKHLVLPEKGTRDYERLITAYEERDMGGEHGASIWAKTTLLQFMVMCHCRDSHFEDWLEHHSFVERLGDRDIVRPPRETTVILPRWQKHKKAR